MPKASAGIDTANAKCSNWRLARDQHKEAAVVDTAAEVVPIQKVPACVQDDVPVPLSREGRERAGLGCTIRLRSGIQMPQMGLGGGSLDGAAGRDAVAVALMAGYRLIDTALYYGNESDIVTGIRQAGLERRDVFLATKLLQKAHVSSDKVRASFQESLKNLRTNYVDLYMIHNPRAGKIMQVWPILQELREKGLIRVLGVSNFGVAQLEGMRQAGLELPEVNQVEVHCWRQLPELIEYHRQHSIATMCMAPLARGQLFGQTGLKEVAKSLGRSEAEVAIRWSLQRGFIPIPKSIQPQRIISNAAEGFDLTARDMERIRNLDTGYMSCKVASPCCELPWELLADSIPDPALWQPGGRKGTGKGKGRASGYEYD
jgi:diketogulonate reductase-like aldo/keto reductase